MAKKFYPKKDVTGSRYRRDNTAWLPLTKKQCDCFCTTYNEGYKLTRFIECASRGGISTAAAIDLFYSGEIPVMLPMDRPFTKTVFDGYDYEVETNGAGIFWVIAKISGNPVDYCLTLKSAVKVCRALDTVIAYI